MLVVLPYPIVRALTDSPELKGLRAYPRGPMYIYSDKPAAKGWCPPALTFADMHP